MYSEDLRLKNYSERTIANYCSQVRKFLEYFKDVATKPSEISERKIKEWLLLAETINTRKHRLAAVKLFYSLTGKQPLKLKRIEYPRSEKHLPKVIDQEKIISALDKIENLKHKALLTLAFSVGLRISEVINLKIADIDSARMIIHIKNAKGRKDRVVPLSEHVLILLRQYFKQYKPSVYLFNGESKTSLKYSRTSAQNIFKKYIDRDSHFHILRHSSFTALLDNGTDLRLIQKIAGHKSSRTTEIYTHVSNRMLAGVKLPV